MKTGYRRAGLTAALFLILGGMAGCSDGGEGPSGGDDTPFNFPTDNKPQPTDVVSEDMADGADFYSDADVYAPDLEDVPLDPDLPDALPDPDLDSLPAPDEFVAPDEYVEPDLDVVEQQDGDEIPTEYPYQTFGPLTISMKGPAISGQFVQMRMAELSYWKFPKERWEPLMTRIQQAGFNGIYTSACWAHHEPEAGSFDFLTGNKDLQAFLELASSKGFYVYLAAGPWVDGEEGGCLPRWVTAGANGNPSQVADGQMALRLPDADYIAAVGNWFDQLNGIVSLFQVTSFPQGPVVFYQVESNFDLYYFLRDAAGKVAQEMLGVMPQPVNIGLYMAQLRDLVQGDGINVPLVTSITGDFENGGRRVLGTGDTPGIYPVVDMHTDSPYDPMEMKLWSLRKEMRKTELHGEVYKVVPGMAVGVVPSATHMARLLMAGADVVVVKDFAASLLGPDRAPVTVNRRGIRIFSDLPDAAVSLGTPRQDLASPIALSGLPRKSFYAFKQLNTVMNLFGNGIAARDLPYRIGPNKSSPLDLKVTNEAVGAIEEKFIWPAPGPAQGITELFGDHFVEWFQQPHEATGRATYYLNGNDGTVLVHLVSLDDLDGEANAHKRQSQVTKLLYNGQEIPRHTNIVVPATDDDATGEEPLGWGSKFVVLNHPLGIGYPLLEYSTANISQIRDFNGRLLIVVHGKPQVKAGGVYLTESGELSFAAFGGIPDVLHNSLPGGGIHTDPGGRLAVSFQHSGTGSLLLQLPGGKQLQVLVTTSDLAQNAWFTKTGNGYDLGVFGMDEVTAATESEEGTLIEGAILPPQEKFLVLTKTKPYDVEADGDSVDCDWNDGSGALTCTVAPQAVPEGEVAHTALYTRAENFYGDAVDLGTGTWPESFATVEGAPKGLVDPQLGVTHGIAWYHTQVELGAVQPNQEGFLSIAGAADIASIYINGTYLGTATPAGNIPMAAGDVAVGLPTAGFRIPAGILQQGINTVAVRTLVLGRADTSMPLLYATAPLLPQDKKPLAGLLPHFAVEGTNTNGRKGIWGPVKVTVGAMSVPLGGPWTVSVGDEEGLAYSRGMLEGWHELGPATSAAANAGFGTVSTPTDDQPVVLGDGQATWMTTTFATGDLAAEGDLDLVLEGEAGIALVFLNGTWVGTWFSDEESLSQGLHSKLVQGAGTRQVFVDREASHFYADPDRIRLPRYLMTAPGEADNRVTCLVLDTSVALTADLVLPKLGTIAGEGRISRFELAWNRDQVHPDQSAPGTLVRTPFTLNLLAPPLPPNE